MDVRDVARRSEGIQVLRRAAEILRVVGEAPDGVTFKALIERLGLPRSTVYRIVGALEEEGFLLVNRTRGRIMIGADLHRLTAGILRTLSHALHPYLVKLSELLNETVDLAVLQGDRVLFIDQVVVPNRLQAVSGVGTYFPVYCTANGKALLAELPTEEAERLLPDELPPLTPYTQTSKEKLLAELAEIRKTHVAYDREEHTLGICAIGFSVKDVFGRLAAITVPTPAQRFYANEVEIREKALLIREEILAAFQGRAEG